MKIPTVKEVFQKPFRHILVPMAVGVLATATGIAIHSGGAKITSDEAARGPVGKCSPGTPQFISAHHLKNGSLKGETGDPANLNRLRRDRAAEIIALSGALKKVPTHTVSAPSEVYPDGRDVSVTLGDGALTFTAEGKLLGWMPPGTSVPDKNHRLDGWNPMDSVTIGVKGVDAKGRPDPSAVGPGLVACEPSSDISTASGLPYVATTFDYLLPTLTQTAEREAAAATYHVPVATASHRAVHHSS